MFESVIRALIGICLLAVCYFLILWVLGVIGLAIPHQVATILLVIIVLIATLILYRAVIAPYWGKWFP